MLGHRLLRWTAATTATSNLFSAMTSAILLGSAIGGALGQAIGPRPTLWIAAVAGLLPVAPALASRIWWIPSVEEAVARFLPAPAAVQPEAPEPTPLAAGPHVA